MPGQPPSYNLEEKDGEQGNTTLQPVGLSDRQTQRPGWQTHGGRIHGRQTQCMFSAWRKPTQAVLRQTLLNDNM